MRRPGRRTGDETRRRGPGMKLLLGMVLAILGLAAAAVDLRAAPKGEAGPLMVLETTQGEVTIRLRPDLAPRHVERIQRLAGEKFYDGAPFHRVIENFMAQTGDPTGTGQGGSRYPNLRAEVSRESFRRGTVGAARADHPDSANSQFFICTGPAPWLDGRYTIVGEVVEGMDVVDKLKKGQDQSGVVLDPDRIVRARVAQAGR